ncbi:MAG: glycoside hydrolase family 2 TIM barrel-domain containing protein, partial [Akkermansia sp.]
MKFLTILPFIFIGSSLSSSAISHESSLSSPSIPLVNWLFSKMPASEEQNLWEKVKVPHCWNATDAQHGNGKEDNLHYGYYRGAGTYKTTLPPSKQYKGNQVYVRFNAISNFAEIYINGVKAGEHAGAFGAFGYRITDMLHQDKPNTLEVRANNAFRKDILPISGDFPVYGGMYRPVTIELRPNICISPIRDGSWGVQTTQSSSEQSFKLNIKTNIDNQTGTSQQGTLTIKLHDKNKQLAQIKKTVTIPRGDSTISETLPIQNPHLWNGVQDPYLHTLTVQIQANGITNQAKPVKIGFRNIDFSPDKGLFLNGKPLKIHGVCRHQDRENLGWALSAKHHLEDVQIMQEMGVNAVRLAHYPQAEELLDALDECGILVWAEIPYVDSIGKPKADGVEQITKQQLKEMIRQQINHPSIMVWGLSNELMQRSTDDPLPLMRELNALAHQEDPSRKTTCAVNRIGNTALC